MVKHSKKLGKKGQRNMTYRKKKYNNRQSVKKVKSGKKTSVRRSRKKGGASPKVIKALKEFYGANIKIEFKELKILVNGDETEIPLSNSFSNDNFSTTPTPAFLSLVLLKNLHSNNNTRDTETKTNFLNTIEKLQDLRQYLSLSGGGKQKGGTFNNAQKISIVAGYIALLKEFISIRRPYTFASYRMKHLGSVIRGVKIVESDKITLKKLFKKLSGGIYYETLKQVLTDVQDVKNKFTDLFPVVPERQKKILSKDFLKKIEELCNQLDKVLFMYTHFLILPPPPRGRRQPDQPMDFQALGYAAPAVAPEVSDGYTVVPSQAQTQAEAAANLAQRGQPPLYAEIADPIYFDVNAAGDDAGIQPRVLDRHISLFGADDVTLDSEDDEINIDEDEDEDEDEVININQTERIQSRVQALLMESLERFKSVVNDPSLSAQGGVYTLLPE